MNKTSIKHANETPSAEDEWFALGGANIWLPYEQMKNAPVPVMAERTQGSRITLKDGHELIDGIASWWTACHGYNHPHIVMAMQGQLMRMPHVMFGGMNHEPALRLAKRLAALTPGDLNRVFFSDSGSVAVEVALKMAVQCWINKGEKGRSKFVSFRHAYHGDTMACMALADPEDGMHERFKGYLSEQFIADLPRDEKSAEIFNELLNKNRNRIAAVIIEPLVQGAGGMKFHDAITLKRVAEICKKHGVLLIADEIFTGFGRTGSMFACEQAGVMPDIMCVGKALTGGAIGLAATIARDHVFAAFWSDDPKEALMHGPTYMANPLACAAANASLDLFEREPRLEQAKKIETMLREGLKPCRNLPGVIDVRVKGAIGVVQLKKIRDRNALKQEFITRGVWIRPFGDIIYLTPAFTIDNDELERLTDSVCAVVKG
jgi:adenosylmethionine-8-amino-7-oxononanoate aminotransferase